MKFCVFCGFYIFSEYSIVERIKYIEYVLRIFYFSERKILRSRKTQFRKNQNMYPKYDKSEMIECLTNICISYKNHIIISHKLHYVKWLRNTNTVIYQYLPLPSRVRTNMIFLFFEWTVADCSLFQNVYSSSLQSSDGKSLSNPSWVVHTLYPLNSLIE